MDKPLWMWGVFFATILLLLVFDLGFLRRGEREIGVGESLGLSVFYILVSLGFSALVFHSIGQQQGVDFLAGYVIEKSLSMDNIFVMSLVFSTFYIPRHYQHRALIWGVVGAIVMRGVMIGLGVALIHAAHFVLYIFGLFLVVTGLRMLMLAGKAEKPLQDSKILFWLKRIIPVTDTLRGSRFFVYEKNALGREICKATPLFLALALIELADIAFAVDSVPAVFAVTTDLFIVYTSNIFAILGLRALYFAFAAMLHRFVYLKHALSLILIFIGGKIFLGPIVSSAASFGVTLLLLALGILASLYKTKNK